MGFLLESTELLSRKLRINQIAQKFDDLLDNTESTDIVRKVSNGIKFIDEKDNGGNIINKIWNIGSGIAGLLMAFVKGIVFSASAILSWIRNGWNFLINFDWNASDQSLITQMENNNQQLAAAWGGFLGQVLGTAAALVVGEMLVIGIGGVLNFVIPGLGAALTPELARLVSIETIKERLPELLDELGFALTQTGAVVLKNIAIGSYIGIRNLLKSIFPEQLKNWGTGDRWTIAEKLDDFFDGATGNQMIDTALEEGYEEFGESFWETGFVYAHLLDDELAKIRETREAVLGQQIPQVTIELDPDSNEKMIIPNQPSNLAQLQVLNDINTFRKIRNRDIGYFSGEPIKEESRRFNYLRTGKAVFRSIEKPPFGNSKESTITLKDLKPNLKWRDFKTALHPYNWGNNFVWITLNRSRHEIGAWFSTINEGETYLKNLVELIIDDDYIAIDSKTEVERNRYVKKTDDFQLMYPTFLTITIKTPVTDREDATHDLAGNSYEKELNKVPLWTDKEPPIDGLNNTEFLT